MKRIIFILLILQTLSAFAQFSDNFNDGKFEADREVIWTGDVAEFVVNDALQLQLRSADKVPFAQLRTPSSIVKNTQWEFYVKMNFNPTAGNHTKVYLSSDEADLNGDLNGLFVRIGYTNKNICLIQSRKGLNNRTLITGESQRVNLDPVAVNIKVTSNAKGKFNLYSRLETESEYTLEGSCDLADIPASNWFGLACVLTTTRFEHFFFDDFVVQEWEDDDDPGADPTLPQEGDIVFSEIMANPGTGSSDPEYVELYNTTDKTFQLKDCKFYYGNTAYNLPAKDIPPHSYFVLCKTAAVSWFSDIDAIGVTFAGKL
jgi:hypothetical protein